MLPTGKQWRLFKEKSQPHSQKLVKDVQKQLKEYFETEVADTGSWRKAEEK